MNRCFRVLLSTACLFATVRANRLAAEGEPASGTANSVPKFSRHISAVFSRLGCNAGSCHGAVQGQNGFRLSLFSAKPAEDFEQLVRGEAGRRVNLNDPDDSLFLLKAAGQMPHGGGILTKVNSPEYLILLRWIDAGAPLDDVEQSKIGSLRLIPNEHTIKTGERYQLRVEATFSDGTVEDVTTLCSFKSIDGQVASVDSNGLVQAIGVGDTNLLVRFRAEPVLASVVVPRTSSDPFPEIQPRNFVDEQVLAKLRRLNIPPVGLTDDATFLRRVTLDVTGELPTPDEIRTFLSDTSADKREQKIDELLKRPGYAALWTLKFCDILGASDFGVYADGLKKESDAPRFTQWVRARLEENTPYDKFAARILLATSRDGMSLDEWAKDVVAMLEGATSERKDVDHYSQRKTLDLYWQRRGANGLSGTLQVAHSFLGLRLECARCHRHPHDVWQQDDLLSFANFFMRVSAPGFRGDNAKKFPETNAIVVEFGKEAKMLAEDAKKLRAAKWKTLDAAAKEAKRQLARLQQEIRKFEESAKQAAAVAESKRRAAANQPAAQAGLLKKEAAEFDKKAQSSRQQAEQKQKEGEPLQATIDAFAKFSKEVGALERRGKLLPEAGKRLLHAEIRHLSDETKFASVTSPLGTQTSKDFRLLGQTEPIAFTKDQDPRVALVDWMRRPDNPYFAKAIVNRVWAHYFGRGIVDPPDHLSPFNPPTHPKLLEELSRQFIAQRYDLKWLHRTILGSRTYQQTCIANEANQMDRSNYAYFYVRRMPAEVLVDALNQATGTTENMDMKYWNWPDQIKTVEIPYMPRNSFVTFMLEQFGRPKRNSAVQCDCERDPNASIMQILSFANHPRVLQKINDAGGRVGRILKEHPDQQKQIEEIFLSTLSRLPDETERKACLEYVAKSESADKGLQGVMWSLLNTREFVLQH